MPAIWFGAAVSVGIIAVLGCQWYTLTAIMPSSPHTLSNSTHLHIAGAMASIWRALISMPCMVPALSAVPIACTGSVDVGEDRELLCVGLIEVLAGQRAFARSIAFYTLPPDNLLSPVQALVDLNVTTPLLGLFPAREQEFARLRQRWIEGLLELVINLELSVARLTSTELAVRGGVSGMKVLLGFFSPKVTLRTAMEIALEGITDSMSYLHLAITKAQTLTGELREKLEQDVAVNAKIASADADNTDDDRARAVFAAIRHVGIEESLRSFREDTVGARAVFAAIQDLVDVDESLQSLREDTVEALQDLLRRAPSSLAALTCPIHDVDGWLRIHCNALRGLVDSLDRLRGSVSLLHGRQVATVDEDVAVLSPATGEIVP